ncbi:MAG: glycosyltransferase family 39 protein [Anaerolineae bacterium]
MKRETQDVWGLLLCLLAWTLRLTVVGVHRLHPDEALYGHWGLLILSGRDPWLSAVPVYKPPLLPYLLSGSLALLGPSELAVRLPGLMAGLATVGLTGRLVRRLYRDSMAGLAAALVVALSPFGILFSATGFTDPLMVVMGLAACVAAVERQSFLAGVLAGLSLAAKRTGVVWLPLVGLLAVSSAFRGRGVRLGRELARAVTGFLAVVGLVVGWDQVRMTQGAQGFWGEGVIGYGGLRLIWPAELTPRLRAWVGLLRYLLGSPLLEVAFIGGATALVVRALGRRDWSALFDLILIGFCLAYLLVHWLWAFPVWDRYLLPLVPLAAALLGRAVSAGARLLDRRWAAPLALSVVALCLVVPAGDAVAGRVPVGAGLATHDGIEQVTDFLRELPEGTVLYHHWLGWEYRFYLFDAPLYLAYWPTPAWLARDVRAFGEAEPRYVVFPAWESSARVERALANVGYRLELMLEARAQDQTVSFRVYRIEKLERVRVERRNAGGDGRGL